MTSQLRGVGGRRSLLAFAFVLALIWMGDGSTSVFRKALVVLGVALSVGGIAMLRYLLISSFCKGKAQKNA
jgi:hypothetical protein